MKSITIFLFFSLIISLSTFAQFSETISSDRPGQSNSPNTLGKMVLQLQTGPQFDGASGDNYKYNGFSWPVVIRFGIAERIDVITVWGYQSSNTDFNIFEFDENGINAADFGLRFNIFEETDNAPALGFEAYYQTKLLSSDYKPDNPSAKFNLMASKTITDIFSITTNLGTDFDGNGESPTGFYTLNLVLGVNDELSVFFENYGNFHSDDFNTYFDFGGAFLLSTDLQLDLYGGFGYNDEIFSYLVSAGVSYRITKWRKDE